MTSLGCRFVDVLYLPAESGEKLCFGALTIAVFVDLLLGEMLDVARYGQYGRKLRLLCQG
jgi:hypothetical protein